MHFEFRDPWFLLAMFLAPVAFVLARRVRSTLQFSSLETAEQASGSWRTRLLLVPPLLSTMAVVLLAIALAGPRTPDEETKVHREGIAVMMVIDRSGSMEARDMVRGDNSVNRLDTVKLVFEQFVLGDGESGRGRPDDMIGLISFASFADSLCPLTLDHGNLVAMSQQIEIASAASGEDGTAVGEGLALAGERLRQH